VGGFSLLRARFNRRELKQPGVDVVSKWCRLF